MLVYLEVENFQMHKHLRLDFVPGVNVLQGESDVGKSCLIRALLWVMTNRPVGFNFRHWDCKKNDQVKVSIEIQQGDIVNKIVRIRSEAVNEYWLNDQVFKAMGASVPEPILQVLNMQDFNMQTQYLPHFLLSVSAGEVAKSLNAACDLSVIDRTIKGINAIATKAKADCKYAEKEAQDIEQKLEALDWLEQAKEKASILASEIQINEKKRQKAENLKALIIRIDSFENDLKSKQGFLEYWQDLSQIDELLASFTKMQVQRNGLHTLLLKAFQVKKQLQTCKQAQIPPDDLISLDETIQSVTALRIEHNDIQNIVSRISEISDELFITKKQYKKLKIELSTVWDSLEYCPLCNQIRK